MHEYTCLHLLHTLPDPSLLLPSARSIKRATQLFHDTSSSSLSFFDVLVCRLPSCTPYSQTALIVRQSTQRPSTLQVSRVYSLVWLCAGSHPPVFAFPLPPAFVPLHCMRFFDAVARRAIIVAQNAASRRRQSTTRCRCRRRRVVAVRGDFLRTSTSLVSPLLARATTPPS